VSVFSDISSQLGGETFPPSHSYQVREISIFLTDEVVIKAVVKEEKK